MELDDRIQTLEPHPNIYDQFQSLVWEISKRHIPRGCRKSYIPCLSEDSKDLYEEYVKAYEVDPFAEETIAMGESVLASVSEERRERWKELITNVDMTQNSKKAWSTIKKLNSDKNPQASLAAVTPNEVATQLLLNGKPLNKERGHRKKMKEEMENVMLESEDEFADFTISELEDAIKLLKPGKAAGLDGITTEVIRNFGPKAKAWLLQMFNTCATTLSIPKVWRKAKVVALLKPNKDPSNAKSYRPVSLLCILFKLYERMILARIGPIIDELLSPDQAGFRPGRSCCGQVLNITQHIEDGFETGKVTGAVFVDLTAAYDTVNHRLLLLKLAKMVRNTSTVRIIQSLLENRRFFVEMDGKRSRWRSQTNGLPQGSVLAPTLFNVYTNDLPQFNNIRRFIYADDLGLTTQHKSFEVIERRLTAALNSLSVYYKNNFLNANPSKTQVCAFHLNNHQAKRQLNIVWNGKKLANEKFPVYLGVTMDRTLSYREHVRKLKEKVASRNNLLNNLTTLNWGADANTLRSTALALCYSTAEYCSPAWERSCHASKVDAELNTSCRIITGALRPTPLPALYRLAGIAPPPIRREALSRTQKFVQEQDSRHPLHYYHDVRRRLKSRKSFMTIQSLNPKEAAKYRVDRWKASDTLLPNEALQTPCESLPHGTHLPRREWVDLNRARCGVGRTRDNLLKWGRVNSAECRCGHPTQTMGHITKDCVLGPNISNQDLLEANEKAVAWLQYWHGTL